MLIQVEKEMTDTIMPLMSAHLHYASDITFVPAYEQFPFQIRAVFMLF